jgi:hypothetical protein
LIKQPHMQSAQADCINQPGCGTTDQPERYLGVVLRGICVHLSGRFNYSAHARMISTCPIVNAIAYGE